MWYKTRKLATNLLVSVTIMATLLIGGWPLFYTVAAAPLQSRSLQMSNNTPGAIATYNVSMSTLSSSVLGSVKIEFCANTALFTETCDPPSGLDDSSAVLNTQTGLTGFSISGSSTNNVIILSRTASPSVPTSANFIFDNIKNLNYKGSFFARYSTYSSTDGSGGAIDQGSIATYTDNPVGVTTEVPPYLLFCAGVTITGLDCRSADGNYINFGTLSVSHPSYGVYQLLIGTNAANGYSIAVTGVSPTSGNNAIPALTSPTFSAPGTSQFGINLISNTNPVVGQPASGPGIGVVTSDYGQANKFVFKSGDIVATGNTVEDYRKYSVSYLVNIGKSQPPGVYASTFTYVCVANF